MVDEGKSEQRQLGALIRKKRHELDLTQEEFAELCGLHRTYIGQLERGEKNLSFSNILRLAKAFNTRPSGLLDSAGL